MNSGRRRAGGCWRKRITSTIIISPSALRIPLRPILLHNSQLNEISGFVSDSLTSDGKGRSYGLELTVEKSLTAGIYLMSTTSIYKSKYTGRDGIERDSRFNGKYVQNLLAGKEWRVGKSKTNIFAANIKLLAAGGNRTTPIDLEKSREKGPGRNGIGHGAIRSNFRPISVPTSV